MGFEAVRQLVAMLDGDKAVADLESDHGMAVQRQRDGGKTALRCRIIERDSIVSCRHCVFEYFHPFSIFISHV